ncbi:hypothetical protein PENNAL_c0001G03645 [Penicillium nalgiovense]|uniref:Uncharacterized protein n=1 Tax=Penicillium nalgiovense TaxID=60175 RepID=A0A1V6ZAZ8_PENNA|nr:hypothetical protein PENNAL_c0001G03645 [Penicillium nalgiovense]
MATSETLRIANTGHVQNELRPICDLASHRAIILDPNAEHTAEALVGGFLACLHNKLGKPREVLRVRRRKI